MVSASAGLPLNQIDWREFQLLCGTVGKCRTLVRASAWKAASSSHARSAISASTFILSVSSFVCGGGFSDGTRHGPRRKQHVRPSIRFASLAEACPESYPDTAWCFGAARFVRGPGGQGGGSIPKTAWLIASRAFNSASLKRPENSNRRLEHLTRALFLARFVRQCVWTSSRQSIRADTEANRHIQRSERAVLI